MSASQEMLRLERLSELRRDQIRFNGSLISRNKTTDLNSPQPKIQEIRKVTSAKEEPMSLMIT